MSTRSAAAARSVDPDVRLLRNAARAVAAQIAVAVAAVVLVVAAAAWLVAQREENRLADQISHGAWASADDVGDPPDGSWLINITPAGHRQVSPGAPAALRDLDPATLPTGIARLRRDHRDLVVYTGRRKMGQVSAVYDLNPREVEERKLALPLGIAALVGVAGAGAAGALIGRRAVRPLGQAMALQRRFVADASHELRTPLSVLLLRSQLLRRRLPGTVPAERIAELDRLVHDAKVLGDVVNDLLLSLELRHRAQGGEPVDVTALALDVVESLRPLADQRAVQLSVEPAMTSPGTNHPPLSGVPTPNGLGTNPPTVSGPPAISSGTRQPLVNGAPAALRRALVSLIDNALAHTPDGGRIRVAVTTPPGQVSLSVIDDGEGLDPGQADRLVERFSRGTSIGSGRRFGLGLALVDEVARAHGGNLVVAGQLGVGASFTLLLPAAPPDRAATGTR